MYLNQFVEHMKVNRWILLHKSNHKRHVQDMFIKIWYYNKSINWDYASDFIENFENIIFYWDKIFEDSI